MDVDLLQRTKGFFATRYGRGLWVDGPVDWTLVTGLVQRSYRVVTLKRMLRALG